MSRVFARLTRIIPLACSLAIAFFSYNCTKTQHPGIEVGNPTGTASLVGLLVIVKPERSQGETYELSITSETGGVLVKFASEVESQVVTFENITENSFVVNATFSDGRAIRLEINYNSDNQSITAASLLINNGLEPSTFSTLGDTLACNTGTTNGAEQLSQAICNRIVSCTTTISCGDCNTGINGSDQLTDEFGLPFADGAITFGEVISQVDSGSLSAEPTMLNNCAAAISNLTCGNISQGFNESFPTNYQNIENFIPEDPGDPCPLVFQ